MELTNGRAALISREAKRRKIHHTRVLSAELTCTCYWHLIEETRTPSIWQLQNKYSFKTLLLRNQYVPAQMWRRIMWCQCRCWIDQSNRWTRERRHTASSSSRQTNDAIETSNSTHGQVFFVSVNHKMGSKRIASNSASYTAVEAVASRRLSFSFDIDSKCFIFLIDDTRTSLRMNEHAIMMQLWREKAVKQRQAAPSSSWWHFFTAEMPRGMETREPAVLQACQEKCTQSPRWVRPL